MRKIIGIGETILDIIFRNGQPSKAVPGGSTFNTTISLGRLGLKTSLITELGNDQIGKLIINFMQKNEVGTEYIDLYSPEEGKTPVSLAFLDESNNAHYSFYHHYPDSRLNVVWPRIDEGDIIIFGSYFSVNPALRQNITDIIKYAKTRKAIIYYDPNFRPAHSHETMKLMPSILENLEFADIVRGSSEDFQVLFRRNVEKTSNVEAVQAIAEKTYIDNIKFYCPNFIYTAGDKGVSFFCNEGKIHFKSKKIVPLNTIGAGDTFNAGILFGLICHNVTLDNLNSLTLEEWKPIIEYGIEFSSAVCLSEENYLPATEAARYHGSFI